MKPKLLLCLALLLGMVAGCSSTPQAPPDAIDRLADDLKSTDGLWLNGFPPAFTVNLPPTATTSNVVAAVFHKTLFDPGRVKQYTILETRRVNIPEGTLPCHYTMVLAKTNLGEKIVVIRYSKADSCWWHRAYDADSPPYLRYY
jgi:hypothetical protein